MGRKTKQEIETARELGYILYMNGTPNIEIAQRVGVSQQTVTAWVNKGDWKVKKAAKTITRTELVNGILNQISGMLNNEELWTTREADKLVKLAAVIERLDKKNSPVVSIEVFIQFIGFLHNQLTYDKDLDLDFVKKVNKYQDAFVSSIMTTA